MLHQLARRQQAAACQPPIERLLSHLEPGSRHASLGQESSCLVLLNTGDMALCMHDERIFCARIAEKNAILGRSLRQRVKVVCARQVNARKGVSHHWRSKDGSKMVDCISKCEESHTASVAPAKESFASPYFRFFGCLFFFSRHSCLHGRLPVLLEKLQSGPRDTNRRQRDSDADGFGTQASGRSKKNRKTCLKFTEFKYKRRNNHIQTRKRPPYLVSDMVHSNLAFSPT